MNQDIVRHRVPAVTVVARAVTTNFRRKSAMGRDDASSGMSMRKERIALPSEDARTAAGITLEAPAAAELARKTRRVGNDDFAGMIIS